MADADLIIDARVVTKGVDKGINKTRKGLSGLAKAAIAASAAFSVKAFVDYEKALIGLGKTSDIQGNQLKKLGTQFKALSERIPVSTNQLLDLGKTAAQLGVTGEKNIVKFTETLAKLSSATDIIGEEGAANIARLLNITEQSVDNVDRFGAAIVELGNNFAATEAEILRNATRIAQGTAAYDVSTEAVLGFATATKASGVEAERAGTAFQKTFRAFEDAVNAGGEELENFVKLTGSTTEEFRELQKNDPAELFRRFIVGLEGVRESGGSATQVLDTLNLAEIRTSQTLLALAKNSQLVTDALNTSNQAYQKNIALNEEAQRAFDSVGSTLTKLGNTIVNEITDIVAANSEGLNSIFKTLQVFVRSVGDSIEALFRGFNRLGNYLSNTWAADVSGALGDVVDVIANFPKAFAKTIVFVDNITSSIALSFEELGLSISEVWNNVKAATFGVLNDIAKQTAEVLSNIPFIGDNVSSFVGSAGSQGVANAQANSQRIAQRRASIDRQRTGLAEGLLLQNRAIDDADTARQERRDISSSIPQIESAFAKVQELSDANPQAAGILEGIVSTKTPEQAEADLAKQEQQDEAKLEQQGAFLDNILGLETTNTKKRAGLKDDLTKADQKANDNIVSQNLNAANQILGIFSQNSKSVAKVQQGLNLGLAIADTAVNAVKAYQSQLIPGDPTSLGRAFAAAAVSIAQGVTQQGIIKNAFAGFEKGGINVGNEPFIAGEAGAEIVVPSSSSQRILNNLQSRNIMERMNDNNEQPVNVNISAEGNIDDIISLINFRIREQDRADIS